jgi:hypothetical protein
MKPTKHLSFELLPGWVGITGKVESTIGYPVAILEEALPVIVDCMIDEGALYEFTYSDQGDTLHGWNFKYEDNSDPINPFLEGLLAESPFWTAFRLVGAEHVDHLNRMQYNFTDLIYLADRISDSFTAKLITHAEEIIVNHLLSKKDLVVISISYHSRDIASQIARRLFYHDCYINAIREGMGLPPKVLHPEDALHLREIYHDIDALQLPRVS